MGHGCHPKRKDVTTAPVTAADRLDREHMGEVVFGFLEITGEV